MPEIGTKRADQAKRAGVAERLAEPAAPPRRTVALALLDDADERRQALALALVRTAKPPAPHPLSLLQTVPGMGTSLRLVRLEEMPDLARGPRGPDCVSWCRVGKCAQASAGTRAGTSGTQRGHAELPWAFADAALLVRRNHPAGP
jgi:transposase